MTAIIVDRDRWIRYAAENAFAAREFIWMDNGQEELPRTRGRVRIGEPIVDPSRRLTENEWNDIGHYLVPEFEISPSPSSSDRLHRAICFVVREEAQGNKTPEQPEKAKRN